MNDDQLRGLFAAFSPFDAHVKTFQSGDSRCLCRVPRPPPNLAVLLFLNEPTHRPLPSPHLGKSRGFGIVRFVDGEQAQQAINALNGMDVEGRPIEVREDRPRPSDEPRPQRRTRKPRGPGRCPAL